MKYLPHDRKSFLSYIFSGQKGWFVWYQKAMLLCLQIWITMQPWNRVKVWQERPFGTECRLVTFKVCLDVEKLEGKVAAQIVPMHKVVLLLCHDKLYTTNANKLYILFSGSKTMFYSHICRLLTICNAIVHLSFVNYLLKQNDSMPLIQYFEKWGLEMKVHNYWYMFLY